VGTANEMNLPPDFDHKTLKTGFEFSDGARAARLHEAMGATARWSVADNQALQADVTSITARRLCRVLADAKGFGAEASRARALFDGWDHRLLPDSAPAALFEIWFTKHLTPAVMAALAPAGAAALITVPDTALITNLVETCDSGFGGAPARDALLARTLEAAWRESSTLLGADPKAWAWGTLHQGYFEHPLTRLAPDALKAAFDAGPLPKGGSKLTLNNNGYRNTDFRVVSGVSWRMVVDVGGWDNSVTVNAPGQSGDPRSPHYRDHFPLWATERYVPMLYSRAAVEAATERRILLKPEE
jgi:penicillin amidase